jgi:hypothetical protein
LCADSYVRIHHADDAAGNYCVVKILSIIMAFMRDGGPTVNDGNYLGFCIECISGGLAVEAGTDKLTWLED